MARPSTALSVFAVCWPAALKLRHAVMPPAVRRRYDMPLCAATLALTAALAISLLWNLSWLLITRHAAGRARALKPG